MIDNSESTGTIYKGNHYNKYTLEFDYIMMLISQWTENKILLTNQMLSKNNIIHMEIQICNHLHQIKNHISFF